MQAQHVSPHSQILTCHLHLRHPLFMVFLACILYVSGLQIARVARQTHAKRGNGSLLSKWSRSYVRHPYMGKRETRQGYPRLPQAEAHLKTINGPGKTEVQVHRSWTSRGNPSPNAIPEQLKHHRREVTPRVRRTEKEKGNSACMYNQQTNPFLGRLGYQRNMSNHGSTPFFFTTCPRYPPCFLAQPSAAYRACESLYQPTNQATSGHIQARVGGAEEAGCLQRVACECIIDAKFLFVPTPLQHATAAAAEAAVSL